MNLKITKMDKDDLEYLIQNLDEFDEFWNEKILRDEFLNENSCYFVISAYSNVLGFGGLWFNIDEAHIMNIAIKKEHRRKKLGTKLLEYLISYAENEKKDSITLEVNEQNIPAINLYKKLNFEEVGRRKKYYQNTFDAIIMTKKF